MGPQTGLEPVWAAFAVIGALCLALGLGELLWGGRGKAGPPEWWRRLDDTVPEPDPVRGALVGGRDSVTFDGGGGSVAPPEPGPPSRFSSGDALERRDAIERANRQAASDFEAGSNIQRAEPRQPGGWQSVVMIPAGKFGNYWQAVGRCSHSHASGEAAIRCGLSNERPAGSIVAAEPEE